MLRSEPAGVQSATSDGLAAERRRWHRRSQDCRLDVRGCFITWTLEEMSLDRAVRPMSAQGNAVLGPRKGPRAVRMLHGSRRPWRSAEKRDGQRPGNLGTFGELDRYPASGYLKLMRGERLRIRSHDG